MKSFATAAISVGALASAALGLAGAAHAAPAGAATVDQTVSQLQADGYQVILNKVGTAPLNQCAVSAVRPGQTFSRTDSGVPGAGNDVITTVTNKTVYVDVKC
jgi:NADPH:quinone reductase-like Zn-dependent oxidoreductase